jgi:hypothetical protein
MVPPRERQECPRLCWRGELLQSVGTYRGQRGGLTELVWRLMKPFMKSLEKGAETSLFLATVPDPRPFHGGYVIGKSLAHPDPAALDSHLARGLWEESTRLAEL